MHYNPSCIQLHKKDFGKFTSCMTFGAHKLVHSQPFLDHDAKFDTCYQRYVPTYGKTFYIGAQLQSRP